MELPLCIVVGHCFGGLIPDFLDDLGNETDSRLKNIYQILFHPKVAGDVVAIIVNRSDERFGLLFLRRAENVKSDAVESIVCGRIVDLVDRILGGVVRCAGYHRAYYFHLVFGL
jgi:hypothetical protein